MEIPDLLLFAGQRMRHEQDQADFGEFGRLEGDTGDPDPAGGAAHLFADPGQKDSQKEQHTEHQYRPGGLAQHLQINAHHQGHHGKPDQGVGPLTLQEMQAVAVVTQGHDRR
jgi:hypothetical protein